MADKIYRVLDANLSRALEGLRVLEDIARFILLNKKLSKQLKNLRHELAKLFKPLNRQMVGSRLRGKDPGAALDSLLTKQRASLEDLVAANAKRCEQALRVLEESSKHQEWKFAKRLEKIRYQIYQLEKELVTKLS
ncbi:MAG: thiamine-phosphate pyrophosphorylase [Elusimicrobia bacterium]|nr:thiamine-phosphate pyrophosphorylase [Elusimicrobiota bacterium]